MLIIIIYVIEMDFNETGEGLFVNFNFSLLEFLTQFNCTELKVKVIVATKSLLPFDKHTYAVFSLVSKKIDFNL